MGAKHWQNIAEQLWIKMRQSLFLQSLQYFKFTQALSMLLLS